MLFIFNFFKRKQCVQLFGVLRHFLKEKTLKGLRSFNSFESVSRRWSPPFATTTSPLIHLNRTGESPCPSTHCIYTLLSCICCGYTQEPFSQHALEKIPRHRLPCQMFPSERIKASDLPLQRNFNLMFALASSPIHPAGRPLPSFIIVKVWSVFHRGVASFLILST